MAKKEMSMSNFYKQLVDSIWFRLTCMFLAIMLMVFIGPMGIGHGGPSSTNLDARFLYVAGLYWHFGGSPYNPASLAEFVPDLMEAVDRYDFAYPPHISPLCLFLAAFPWLQAKLLMTYINIAAALSLGLLCARFGYGEEGDVSRADTSNARWLITALVIGNFSTAYVIWAGQTTLIVAVALVAGWHYVKRGNTIIGGALLGFATIKPQLLIGPMLWLLLDKRWRALFSAAIVALVLSTVPLLNSDPIDLLISWYSAIQHYTLANYNTLGSRMVFSLPSLLHAIGISFPNIGPLIIVISVGLLWYFKSKVLTADVLAILLGSSLLFGYAHGYDLVILAPMIPAFWRHLSSRPLAGLVALGLFLIITLPNSIFESFGIPLLLHARVIGLLICVVWLCAMSVKRARGTRQETEFNFLPEADANRAALS